jgi:membrane protease YdiL (CAAX protease family)
MSNLPAPILTAALIFECSLLLAGLAVWLLVISRPSVRTQPSRLAPWLVSPSDFLACALAVIGGGYFFQILGRAAFDPLLKKFSASPDTHTAAYGTAFQFGLLAGMAGARTYLNSRRENAEDSPPRGAAPSLLTSGMMTFLAVLPVVWLTSIVWNKIIEWLGLPPEPQDLIDVFARAKLSLTSVVLVLLATVVAPVVEELVFRAGLFRYLRTRIPRWAALLLPSLFFAAAHANWASFGPLTMLAIVFSLAYERTGRIGTTMIAHALFNLNMILLVLVGVTA